MVDIAYGPGIPGETELRLLGALDGKRVLVLGCRRPEPILALAEAGAKVLTVDQSSVRVDRTRQACEAAGIRVEFHRADLADLAFLRQDSIELVLSVYALAEVDDLNRVFRQVHRTLKPGAPIVFSLPHPAAALVGENGPDGRPVIDRSYFDPSPLDGGPGPAADRVADEPPTRSAAPSPAPVAYGDGPLGPGVDHHHGLSAVFTSLSRAGFRLDSLLEPEPQGDDPAAAASRAWAPPTLILRARKEGV